MATNIRKVEIPGERVEGRLADAFGHGPRPEDTKAFEEGLQRVEKAERDADIAGAQIRIH